MFPPCLNISISRNSRIYRNVTWCVLNKILQRWTVRFIANFHRVVRVWTCLLAIDIWCLFYSKLLTNTAYKTIETFKILLDFFPRNWQLWCSSDHLYQENGSYAQKKFRKQKNERIRIRRKQHFFFRSLLVDETNSDNSFNWHFFKEE